MACWNASWLLICETLTLTPRTTRPESSLQHHSASALDALDRETNADFVAGGRIKEGFHTETAVLVAVSIGHLMKVDNN